MTMVSLLSPAARRLEGKVALITGGASGIGEYTAKLFTSHGAKVIIADIQDQVGFSICRDLPNSSYAHCDVRNESHIKNAVDKAISLHGKLDIMFNNAGIGGENKPRIADNSKESFDNVLAVNVTGVFLGIKHAASVMIPARRGCIISTASMASSMGGSASHAYTCAKHAVVGLTKNAAVELGQFGIRVNCLSPFTLATPLASSFLGGITDQQLERDAADVANLKGVTLNKVDVANAAVYLASDESRYVSGHNLLIDGGFSLTNSAIRLFDYNDHA